jgi:hypothetical protein
MTGEKLSAALACQAIVLADWAHSEQWASRWTPIA